MKAFDILNNSHLHTVLPIYLSYNINPDYTRERIDTPDSDFIDMDWINKNIIDAPTVILFHGMEGNSQSHYARRIMYYIEQIGWRGVVPHFRGCSEELNRTLKIYNAYDTSDIIWVIETIRSRTNNKLFIIGVSLGANLLLKLLGENNNNNNDKLNCVLIDAAVAISTPFDLAATTNIMDQGINKHIYAKAFLNTLMPKMKEYANKFDKFKYKFEDEVDTMQQFNELYLSQISKFQNSADYYTQSSCKPYLKNIKIPTMILQAQNDPIIPIESWPNKSELSSAIKFVGTKTGGHGGFIVANTDYKKALLRMPKFIIEYLKTVSKHTINSNIIKHNTIIDTQTDATKQTQSS